MARQIYVNLPVKDLNRTRGFFSSLGFSFNPQFTDDNAIAMIIGEDSFVMLLKEDFFKGFIKKTIADTKTTTEVLISISCESRGMVDEMVSKAIKAGGTESREPQDLGFMYGRSFEDLDGHIWEPFWMDMAQFPQKG
jgi:uncharacterized protein